MPDAATYITNQQKRGPRAPFAQPPTKEAEDAMKTALDLLLEVSSKQTMLALSDAFTRPAGNASTLQGIKAGLAGVQEALTAASTAAAALLNQVEAADAGEAAARRAVADQLKPGVGRGVAKQPLQQEQLPPPRGSAQSSGTGRADQDDLR